MAAVGSTTAAWRQRWRWRQRSRLRRRAAATLGGALSEQQKRASCERSCVNDQCRITVHYGTSQKLYVSTKMSVMKHIFAPLLLRRKEPSMHNQHCRLSIDTMKTLSPGARTLKSLRRPSNRCTHRHHFIRLCSHIVHVERGMFVT